MRVNILFAPLGNRTAILASVQKPQLIDLFKQVKNAEA